MFSPELFPVHWAAINTPSKQIQNTILLEIKLIDDSKFKFDSFACILPDASDISIANELML